MRIALNATCLNDRPSGAKQRFLGIYRELIRLTPNYQYVVLQPLDSEKCTIGGQNEDSGKRHVCIIAARHR